MTSPVPQGDALPGAAPPGPDPATVARPSDPPARAAGTRTRAGNAMGRTRAAILAAAASCVERHGVRRTTMSEVAAVSGVAKATLYNHFRTKDDLLAALVESEVAALVAAGRAAPSVADALAAAAAQLGGSAALRRVAADEPAVLAALLAPGSGAGWATATAGVVAVLQQAGLAGDAAQTGAVLRWLLGHALWPAGEAAGEAALLAAGLATGAPAMDVQEPGAGEPVVEAVLVEPDLEPEPASEPEDVAESRGEQPAPTPRRSSDLGWPG